MIERIIVFVGLIGFLGLVGCCEKEVAEEEEVVVVLSDAEKVEVGVGEILGEVAGGFLEEDSEVVDGGEVVVVHLGDAPVVYTHEVVAMGIMMQIERLAELVGEVKDIESARAVEGDLKMAVERINELNKETERLGEVGDGEAVELVERYGSRTAKAGALLEKNIIKLDDEPEAVRLIGKILDGIK